MCFWLVKQSLLQSRTGLSKQQSRQFKRLQLSVSPNLTAVWIQDPVSGQISCFFVVMTFGVGPCVIPDGARNPGPDAESRTGAPKPGPSAESRPTGGIPDRALPESTGQVDCNGNIDTVVGTQIYPIYYCQGRREQLPAHLHSPCRLQAAGENST